MFRGKSVVNCSVLKSSALEASKAYERTYGTVPYY